MKKSMKKTLSGAAGLTMAAAHILPVVAEAPEAAQIAAEVLERTAAETTPVANITGAFSFNQDVLSPSDDIFSIFGTAVTGVCAKPAFAISGTQENVENHYVNVYGNMKYNFSVSLDELKDKEITRSMACSCAMGEAIINASVTGVSLSAIVEMADLDADVNTVTVKGSDGYGLPMPLTYALEQQAMLVYRINGQPLPENQRTQLWMPGMAAQYFTRDVADIVLSVSDKEPAIKEVPAEHRAKVAIVNYFGDAAAPAGQPMTFEGYADDFGKAITAVEFSMDGGATWTAYETAGATSDRWVYWTFTYTPEEAGVYELQVRAVAGDGTVSPLASSLVFSVSK